MELSQRGEEALVAIRQIVRAIERDSRILAKANGLAPSKLIVLQILDSDGTMSASDLSDRISLSQASVTTLIDKLSARDLVTRCRQDTDKRRVMVSITDDGRKLLGNAPGLLTDRFLKQFEGLEPWQQSSLLSTLEQVSTMLNAEKMDVAPILDVGPITDTLEE